MSGLCTRQSGRATATSAQHPVPTGKLRAWLRTSNPSGRTARMRASDLFSHETAPADPFPSMSPPHPRTPANTALNQH